MATKVTFYKHQDNAINSDYVKMGNIIFRLKNISVINPVAQVYEEGTWSYQFELICDSKTFNIHGHTLDKDDQEKFVESIRAKLVGYVFPKKENKVFI